MRILACPDACARRRARSGPGLPSVQGVGRRYAPSNRRPASPGRAMRLPRAGGAGSHAAERVPAAERSQERRDRGVAQARDVDVLQPHTAGGPGLPLPAGGPGSRLCRAGGPEGRRGAPAHGSGPGGLPMSAPMEQPSLARRLAAEGLGTTLLLATVVGSGIMGERLAGGNVALALLANALATGAGLLALILMLGPISGAHFNPAFTLADAVLGGVRWRDAAGYLAVQLGGAFAGVALAHGMFGEPVFSASRHVRTGGAQFLSEFTATFGLLAVIWGVARRRSTAVPFAVAAYVTAAYWFTASTSFANPAVTMARAVTDTFSGIRPGDVPHFLVAQLLGAAAATLLFRWLVPALPQVAAGAVVPHVDPIAIREAR